MVTEAQLELLRDKYVVWEAASRTGLAVLRDYNRRCAEAMKAILAEHSEFRAAIGEIVQIDPGLPEIGS